MGFQRLLMQHGASQVEAAYAVPALYVSPYESEPTGKDTRIIVRVLQGAFGLPQTGSVDHHTEAALRQRGGPDWQYRPWSSFFRMMRVTQGVGAAGQKAYGQQDLGEATSTEAMQADEGRYIVRHTPDGQTIATLPAPDTKKWWPLVALGIGVLLLTRQR